MTQVIMLLCQVLLLHEKVGKPSCFQIQSKRNHSPVSFRTANMSTEKPIEVPPAHAFLGNRLLTLASSAMRNGLVVTPRFSMATYIDLHASCYLWHVCPLHFRGTHCAGDWFQRRGQLHSAHWEPPRCVSDQCLGWVAGSWKLCPAVSGEESHFLASPEGTKKAASPVLSKTGVLVLRQGSHCSITILISFPGHVDPHRVRPCQVLPPLREHRSGHILCSNWVPCGPHVSSL